MLVQEESDMTNATSVIKNDDIEAVRKSRLTLASIAVLMSVMILRGAEEIKVIEESLVADIAPGHAHIHLIVVIVTEKGIAENAKINTKERVGLVTEAVGSMKGDIKSVSTLTKDQKNEMRTLVDHQFRCLSYQSNLCKNVGLVQNKQNCLKELYNVVHLLNAISNLLLQLWTDIDDFYILLILTEFLSILSF